MKKYIANPIVKQPASNVTPIIKTKNQETQKQESLNIPYWVKNNANWWSEGKIGDNDFTKGIQYMIQEKIMKIPPTASGQTHSQKIPSWIKNNAGWWASGQISDQEFVMGIQYLITNGIVQMSN